MRFLGEEGITVGEIPKFDANLVFGQNLEEGLVKEGKDKRAEMKMREFFDGGNDNGSAVETCVLN